MENKDEKTTQTYEPPEILEIGAAESLTLGWTNRTNPDGCDCTKYL